MDIEPYCFLLQGVDMIIKEFPENLVKLGQENSCSMFFWRADSEDGNRFRFSSSTSHKNTRVCVFQVMFSLCDLRHLWASSPRGSSPSLEQRMEAWRWKPRVWVSVRQQGSWTWTHRWACSMGTGLKSLDGVLDASIQWCSKWGMQPPADAATGSQALQVWKNSASRCLASLKLISPDAPAFALTLPPP